jgi:hypothetical protein
MTSKYEVIVNYENVQIKKTKLIKIKLSFYSKKRVLLSHITVYVPLDSKSEDNISFTHFLYKFLECDREAHCHMDSLVLNSSIHMAYINGKFDYDVITGIRGIEHITIISYKVNNSLYDAFQKIYLELKKR